VERVPSSEPRPTPRVRGFGPLALVAIVLLGVFFGVVPIWQYVDAHRVPGDAKVQTATVIGGDRGPRGTDRGYLVNFRLADGTDGQIYFESRFAHPDSGDTLSVYRDGNDWHSPDERSTYGLLSGIGAVLVFGLLAVGWLRVRRRGSISPTRSAFEDLPPPQR
jgi:hypothetical protein